MFVNINKINLEETSVLPEAVTEALLLMTSLLYDTVVKEKDYQKGLRQLDMVKCALHNVEYVLNNLPKEEENSK